LLYLQFLLAKRPCPPLSLSLSLSSSLLFHPAIDKNPHPQNPQLKNPQNTTPKQQIKKQQNQEINGDKRERERERERRLR